MLNLHVLWLNAESVPVACVVATSVSFGLAFHSASPVVDGRVWPDIAAYFAAIGAHVACAFFVLAPQPLALFVLVAAILIAIPSLLRTLGGSSTRGGRRRSSTRMRGRAPPRCAPSTTRASA